METCFAYSLPKPAPFPCHEHAYATFMCTYMPKAHNKPSSFPCSSHTKSVNRFLSLGVRQSQAIVSEGTSRGDDTLIGSDTYKIST